MTNKQETQQLFLACLRDHLNGRKTDVPPEPDWAMLYELAKAHDMVGVVYHQLKQVPGVPRAFSAGYGVSVFYYAGRNKCYNTLAARLGEQGIPAVPVKGQVIAPLYPVPALRTMGDIDLLIREEDKPAIDKTMTELGYERLCDTAARDWDYKNATIEFEMHPLLIYPDEQVEKKEYIRFFNRYWDYVDESGNLKDEFHLLYLFVHMRKHLLNHGAGVRQFMDIGVFTRAKQETLDWAWLREKMEELQLTRFAEMSYTFIERWFDIPSPMGAVPVEEALYQSSTDRILENGVFGFQSEDDAAALVSYDVAQHGALGRLKYLLRLVFPSYSAMRIIKRYEFVNNKPYLLPAAWVYRVFVVLTERHKLHPGALADKDAMQGRIEMIQQWGM